MGQFDQISKSPWFMFLDHSMQDLVLQSFDLLDLQRDNILPKYHDYSFIVFPIARAYEGFLKKYLFVHELIDNLDLLNPHFRIGRSLNPDLPNKYKDQDWLFDDLQELCRRCGQRDLALKMWKAWRNGRNKLFHYYFPDHTEFIDLAEAQNLIEDFTIVMSKAVSCMHQQKQRKITGQFLQ